FAEQAVDLVEIDAGETGHVGSSHARATRANAAWPAEKRRSIGATSARRQTEESPAPLAGHEAPGLAWSREFHVGLHGGPRMRLTRALFLLVVTAAPFMSAGTEPAAYAARGNASRSVVWAQHGMVCASQPLAVQVGLDVLKRGGTAVDAAIAVN